VVDSRRSQVWSRQERDKGHQTLCDQAKAYEGRSTRRKAEAVQLMHLYEGDTVYGFDRGFGGTADGTSDNVKVAGEPVEITLNLAQALVDTLDAKIAGLENTKSQITTVDASWDVRRRALLVDRFVEGQYYERQGRFQDLWDVFRFALRLALASTRTAAVKFLANPKAGKIQTEVHDTLGMWVDTHGAIYDYPTGMGHTTWWDPEKLIDTYGDKMYAGFADDVVKASSHPRKALGLELFSEDYDYLRQDLVRVPVTEGWRFKSAGRDGTYCMSFPGAKEPIHWDPYCYEDPPFVFVGGQRSLTSFWHRTLTKPIVGPILRVNEILASVDRAERLTPKGVMFYDPEEIAPQQIQVGDDMELIPIPGLSGMKGKPIYEAPPPFHPIVLELVKFYLEQCYNLPGVAELHASGDTSGEWSGAALRIRKQLINERFSTIQRAYVHASTVEATQQIIRCAKELYKQDPKFSALWRGQGFMRQIDARVLGVLDECKYEVGLYPVSESKHTPESELALSQELLQVGIVTGDSYLNTLKWYDAQQGAKSNTDAQDRLIGMQIDKWLTAEPEEMRGNKRFYKGPVRTMQIFAAIIQVNRAYLNAQADDVEPRRLAFFERYLKDLKKFADEQATQQAGLTAQAGGSAAAVQAMTQAVAPGAPTTAGAPPPPPEPQAGAPPPAMAA